MRTRSSDELHYNPSISPVLQLLKGLHHAKGKKSPANFSVSQKNFKLTLNR